MIDHVLRYGPWVVLGAGLLYFAYQFATKGFKGAMFGGKVKKTFGEIPLTPLNGPSGVVRVHRIDVKGEPHIGIEAVQRTWLSYDVSPFTISTSDAVGLVKLLEQAIEEVSKGRSGDAV